MGKSTISMAISNSYVSLPEGNHLWKTGAPRIVGHLEGIPPKDFWVHTWPLGPLGLRHFRGFQLWNPLKLHGANLFFCVTCAWLCIFLGKTSLLLYHVSFQWGKFHRWIWVWVQNHTKNMWFNLWLVVVLVGGFELFIVSHPTNRMMIPIDYRIFFRGWLTN